ncbi:hypothetical protein PL8927_740016 [Planktothrix serta PCC 8927]|uniref:Uncharacterized protein n=1 Tax=Planktothrix serta PCC 8927 TaxID=671068 RepID=A0A7Z9E447_9CYAN|nr:hypothetical protein PL8927_740016 [Planktothrix serta PCC 8927]
MFLLYRDLPDFGLGECDTISTLTVLGSTLDKANIRRLSLN